jgi:acetyl esterase/lipase
MNRPLTGSHRFILGVVLALSFAVAAAAAAWAQATKSEPTDAPRTQEKAKAKPKAKTPTGPPMPPTYADVAYGDHPREVIDFYKAETTGPAPLVVYIHGGGWVNGDKWGIAAKLIEGLRDKGISVAAINYRFTTQADAANVKPPVKWPLEDAARAIQFLRSKAREWNIDKARIGATGGSAGACSSLWLALHDDMARPDSSDPSPASRPG